MIYERARIAVWVTETPCWCVCLNSVFAIQNSNIILHDFNKRIGLKDTLSSSLLTFTTSEINVFRGNEDLRISL
jgi:hypothetical protein